MVKLRLNGLCLNNISCLLNGTPQTLFACALCCLSLFPFSASRAVESASYNEKQAIMDQAGRHVQVREPMQRIISLYGAHTENLFALGLEDEIVGVSRHEVFPPQALDKSAFAAHQDLERFLAPRPDCVLIRPMLDRGYPRLVEGLERLGVQVVSLQPNTVQEITGYWKKLGVLTGRQQAAGEMIDTFIRTLDRFEQLNEKIEQPKLVYFEAIHSKMKTFAPDSTAVFALESAGGINAAADATSLRGTNIAAYGKERILAQGEEIDVYLAQKGPMNQPTKNMIYLESGFQAIKAVRTRDVFIIDEALVSRPTFRLLLGIARIGHLLYPDVYTTDEVDEVRALVRKQYGLAAR
jgi:iron complex transport system substrate-binding protein